jgi:capsular exopolysaccharide synthesis family protein
VEVAGAEKNLRTLMIMNAEPTDAKTIIAANLAIINAQQGKRVILLDADLKRPHLHSLFGMENKNGFAELLNGELDLNRACHVVKDVEGLTLIPSGVMEKESKTWLNAKKWEQLLLELQKQADLVVVDSPRADVADAQILASKVNAVLLAIKPWHTRIDRAQTTLKRLKLTGVWVMGTVWNRTQQSRLKILPLAKIRLPNRKDTHEINGETRDLPVSPS